jgi:hypothetical protein
MMHSDDPFLIKQLAVPTSYRDNTTKLASLQQQQQDAFQQLLVWMDTLLTHANN